MKNYEEIAESVFKRSEEMIALNKRRRRERLINIGATVGCLAVAGAVGIGVWKNSVRGSDIVNGIIINSSGDQTSDDRIDSAGVFDNDTPGYANEPNYGFSYSVSSATTSMESSIGASASSSDAPSTESSVGTSTSSSVGTSAESTVDPITGCSGVPLITFSAGNQPDHQQPITSNGESVDTPKFNTVIENYAATTNRCYLSQPANGTFRYSDALIDAMENCGYTDENGDIQYRVVVNYYDNGQPVDVNSSAIREDEWNRLCGHGYHCEFETCGKDWGNTTEHHFCMLLTRGQLESFPSCDSYGYTICLYGEKNCILSDDNTLCSLPPVQNQNGHHGYEHHNDDHC